MNNTLLVTLAFDSNWPRAFVANLPGACSEASPAELRRLAIALLRAADDCELFAKGAREGGCLEREYSLRVTALS